MRLASNNPIALTIIMKCTMDSMRALCFVAVIAVLWPSPDPGARQVSAAQSAEPMNWTTADDHQNMMTQLGIRRLRPGPSGNESAPNHANYDEAIANPYPDLP